MTNRSLDFPQTLTAVEGLPKKALPPPVVTCRWTMSLWFVARVVP